MFTGISLIFLVGIIWVLIGVLLTRITAEKVSVIVFYMIGCWLASFLSWTFIADWDVLLSGIPPRTTKLALWLIVAGTINSLGQLMLVKAMLCGHKGVSWAIVQMAMLIPFLSSLLFFGEQLTLAGSLGMAALLVAIFLMSKGKSSQNDHGMNSSTTKWVLLVIGALVCIGSSQACQGVPSHWSGWTDTAGLRVCLLSTGGALANTLWVLVTRSKVSLPAIKYGSMWAIFAMLSYLLLFKALDNLAQVHLSCFAFPIGQATCMLGFALYSFICLKEHFNLHVRFGLACGLCGIALMAIR